MQQIPSVGTPGISLVGSHNLKRRLRRTTLVATLSLLLLIGAKVRGQSSPDGFDPGANGSVYALAVQADGKILVGGAFTTLGASGAARQRIARLSADGTLDASFDPGADNIVYAVTTQVDGKILVGGHFKRLGGGGVGTAMRNYIGRLNSDGMLDTSFNPGADVDVRVFALQTDGKILVGGFFGTLGGAGTSRRAKIGRLNPDGTLDSSFNPGANEGVHALALQADGKILVGGSFSRLGGTNAGPPCNCIGRLNPDGTLDTTFNVSANSTVRALAVQGDGKILVGGDFNRLGGGGSGTTPCHRIGRLNSDGTLDTSFNPGANSGVYALALQADGKILVGGHFTTLGGGETGTTTRNRIGRLNSDGTLDTSFDPGANGLVWTVATQGDGKILVGGDFTSLGGGTGITMRNFIGRFTNTASRPLRPGIPTEVIKPIGTGGDATTAPSIPESITTQVIEMTGMGNAAATEPVVPAFITTQGIEMTGMGRTAIAAPEAPGSSPTSITTQGIEMTGMGSGATAAPEAPGSSPTSITTQGIEMTGMGNTASLAPVVRSRPLRNIRSKPIQKP